MRIRVAQRTDSNSVMELLAEQFREHGIDLDRERLLSAVLGLLSQAGRGDIHIIDNEGAKIK